MFEQSYSTMNNHVQRGTVFLKTKTKTAIFPIVQVRGVSTNYRLFSFFVSLSQVKGIFENNFLKDVSNQKFAKNSFFFVRVCKIPRSNMTYNVYITFIYLKADKCPKTWAEFFAICTFDSWCINIHSCTCTKLCTYKLCT